MSEPMGLCVVDKPEGPTSHDVVGRLRRCFGTRRVGHAGTLDPLATGVLVVLVGEATKLATWLSADDKGYVARVRLGRATDALDRGGRVTAEGEIPAWLRAELEALGAGATADAPRLGAALDRERARTEQVPPAFSAIHVEGRRAHELARAGREQSLPPRPVSVRRLVVLGAGLHPSPHLDLSVDVGKGYYVRALARDLGESLGVPAMIDALRRTASGPFRLDEAVELGALEACSPEARRAHLVPIEQAARRGLLALELSAEGARRARHGQPIARGDASPIPPDHAGPVALFDPTGALVGIATCHPDRLVVARNLST